MRLIRTSNLELVEFMGDYDGKYAILSHTWEQEEISFQEMLLVNKGLQPDADRVGKKAGYRKVEKFAALAAARGYEYAWADTCCIDKSSSAELSEAINSMYRWYRNSNHCLVYLADVPDSDGGFERTVAFRNSRWFTRGWTLQELLAPPSLTFYSSGWTAGSNLRGAQSFWLSVIVSDVTGIPASTLQFGANLLLISVAEKMFWASRRATTRIEDRAYSLLGLFDVNMPLLYGEGEKAFLRLQEEICRVSDDESIFAWASQSLSEDEFTTYRGLFAKSPAEFTAPNVDVPISDPDTFIPPRMATSVGFNVHFNLLPVADALKCELDTLPPLDTTDPDNEYLAILSVYPPTSTRPGSKAPWSPRFAIRLKQLSPNPANPQFARVDPATLYQVAPLAERLSRISSVYVRHAIRIPRDHLSSRWTQIYVTSTSHTHIWTPEDGAQDFSGGTTVSCPARGSVETEGRNGVAAVLTSSVATVFLGRRLRDGNPFVWLLREPLPDPRKFDLTRLCTAATPQECHDPLRVIVEDVEMWKTGADGNVMHSWFLKSGKLTRYVMTY